jgi:hypothetical protein
VVDFRNDFLLILRPQADQGLHRLATLKIIPVVHSSPQKESDHRRLLAIAFGYCQAVMPMGQATCW